MGSEIISKPVGKVEKIGVLAKLLSCRGWGQMDPNAIHSPKSPNAAKNHYKEISKGSTYLEEADMNRVAQYDNPETRFLDRLSELFANESGGRTVSCAVMKYYKEQKRVDVWIARNSGFSEGKDSSILGKLENTLKSIAQQKSGYEKMEEKLLQEMIEYASPRLRADRNDFHELLRRLKKRSPDLFESSSDGLKTLTLKINSSLPHEKAKVIHILNNLSSQCESLGEGGQDARKLHSLVYKSYEIRSLYNAPKDLKRILGIAAIAAKLHKRVFHMGRLLAAYDAFLSIASTTKEFIGLKVYAVQRPDPLCRFPNHLYLESAFSLLDRDLSTITLKDIIGRNVDEMKDSNSRPKLELAAIQFVHAEVQLIYHIAAENLEVFPYIGGSKMNCFLCDAFIRSHGYFQTRGGHGHVYPNWTVPQLKTTIVNNANRISKAIDKVYSILKRELLGEWHLKSGVPESPVGPLTPPPKSGGHFPTQELALSQFPIERVFKNME